MTYAVFRYRDLYSQRHCDFVFQIEIIKTPDIERIQRESKYFLTMIDPSSLDNQFILRRMVFPTEIPDWFKDTVHFRKIKDKDYGEYFEACHLPSDVRKRIFSYPPEKANAVFEAEDDSSAILLYECTNLSK